MTSVYSGKSFKRSNGAKPTAPVKVPFSHAVRVDQYISVKFFSVAAVT